MSKATERYCPGTVQTRRWDTTWRKGKSSDGIEK